MMIQFITTAKTTLDTMQSRWWNIHNFDILGTHIAFTNIPVTVEIQLRWGPHLKDKITLLAT